MKHLDHPEVRNAARRIFRTGKRLQDLKGVHHSKKKEDIRFTKQSIENKALSLLKGETQLNSIGGKTDLQRFETEKSVQQDSNKKAFSQVISNPVVDLYLFSVSDPHCTWGEWAGYTACKEIAGDICKRLRVIVMSVIVIIFM